MSSHALRQTRVPGARTVRTERRNRRFFLRTAAGIVAVAGLGIAGWVSTGPSGPSPTPTIDAVESHAEYSLDQLFALQGIPAIRARMTQMNPEELDLAFQWIVDKAQTALYPDMIAFLADPRSNVRGFAAGALTAVPPADLQANLSALEAAANSETDALRQQLMRQLVADVRGS